MTGLRIATLITVIAACQATRAAAQATGTVMASVTVVDTRISESASRIARVLASERTGKRSIRFARDAGGVSVTAQAVASPAGPANDRRRVVTIIFW